MNKLKKITLEIPESTYLMDISYYWKNENRGVKATGIFDEEELVDNNLIKAWCLNFLVTEERPTEVVQEFPWDGERK